MIVKNVIGGVGFVVTAFVISAYGIATYGEDVNAYAVSSSSEVCGVETSDWGAGVMECDGAIHSWANGDSKTSISKVGSVTTTRSFTDAGYVAELTVDSETGFISAYVG